MPAPYDIIYKVVNNLAEDSRCEEITERKSYRGEDYTLNFSVSLGLQRDFFYVISLSAQIYKEVKKWQRSN